MIVQLAAVEEGDAAHIQQHVDRARRGHQSPELIGLRHIQLTAEQITAGDGPRLDPQGPVGRAA